MLTCFVVLLILFAVSFSLNLVFAGLLIFYLKTYERHIDDTGLLNLYELDDNGDNDPADWWKRGEIFNYIKDDL